MTVSTVVDHNDYTGNGVTTSFPYTFRIFQKSDLLVQVVDLDENITELILDADYTVTGAGGYVGGNVVLSAPLTSGWQISIARELEPTQETDLRNQGKFFAEVHEDAFDKLTMLIQQAYSVFRLALRKPSSIANWYDALNNYIRNLKDPRDPQDAATKNYVDTLASSNLSRTLRTPESIPSLPNAAVRANKIIAFDSSGNPFVTLPPSGSATDVLVELAKPTGSSLVGFGNTTVNNSLTRTFEYFGAVGDGTADDTAAIQAAAAWITGGNNRQLTTEGGKIAYRVTATINFNFGNGRGHAILMKSPIRPDAGTGTAFLIQNTRNSVFDLKVDGGGGALVDYTQPDPSGAQTAFVIRGVRECSITINGLGYRGRVLRTKALDASTGGVIKTSFNTINIYTGDRGAGQTVRCGQSMYLQGDDSAFGKIQTAWIPWDEYGSVLEKLVDVTIGNIEFGADTIGGMRCIALASAHIGTLAGGDETFTNSVLRFENHSDGSECIGVNIERIFCTSGSLGVYFKGSNGLAAGTRPNFSVKSIYTVSNNIGVHLDGVNNSDFSIKSRDSTTGVKLSGVIRGLTLDVNIANMAGAAILADSTANINASTINGRCIAGGAYDGTVDLFSASGAAVTFRDFFINTGSGSCYKLPVINVVKLLGGAIDKGTGSAFSQGTYKTATDLDGFVTRNHGGGSIAVGNQTITITHGLAQQPTEIGITPLNTAAAYRILNLTATTFDVRIASAAVTDPYTFNWFASCEFH